MCVFRRVCPQHMPVKELYLRALYKPLVWHALATCSARDPAWRQYVCKYVCLCGVGALAPTNAQTSLHRSRPRAFENRSTTDRSLQQSHMRVRRARAHLSPSARSFFDEPFLCFSQKRTHYVSRSEIATRRLFTIRSPKTTEISNGRSSWSTWMHGTVCSDWVKNIAGINVIKFPTNTNCQLPFCSCSCCTDKLKHVP
jgi:hypothetical protein